MSSINIDENRQSRSIATFGLENIKKISKLNIFIQGINGLSLEASKNLILTGIKSLTLLDQNICQKEDLSWNFYLNEKDINIQRKDESILNKLKELNEYVEVKIENDLEKAINDNDIIVITENKYSDEIYRINEICRKNKKGFIYAGLFGLAGFIFCDFGNHLIIDENGEELQKVFISSIAQNLKENKIIFYINKDENGGINNEKYVKFKEIEGMEELNKLEPTKIYIESENIYYINYNEKLGDYIKGGIIEEVKIPQKINYISYKDYMNNPKSVFELDYSKKDRNCLIHCFVSSIQKFFDIHQRLPDINNDKEAEEIVNFSKEFYLKFKNQENILFRYSKIFDDNFIKNLALYSGIQLPTDYSFLGGVLAQEILKFSGLYRPLNQILYYNNYITIENLKKDNNEIKILQKDRYYYENVIYGENVIKKLKKSNIFVIGAGALGCEIMKILALMGASTEKNANIILTDNDSIELSNLNRQFFFKEKHIGKNKAIICCQEARKINPEINCIPIDKLVNHDSEDFFTDDFWSNLDIVILAVDNVSARKYIDKKCTTYNIKLIEMGTQGVKANSSLIIPHLTSCYNDIKRNPKKEIPQCTLKYYPTTNIHCIEYSRQKFDDFFQFNIKDTLEYIKLKSFSDNYTRENWRKLIIFNSIIKILKNKNFDDCLNLAIKEFYMYFNYNIRELLNNNPPDSKKPDGTLFWYGDKRMPKEIDFNINDDTQIDFIYYYAFIIAQILKIEIKDKNISKEYISKNLINFEKILDDKEIIEQSKKLNEENQKEIDKLNLEEFLGTEYENFEKDNNTNHHIDFLTAFSNLRAKNYKIEQSDKNMVKVIAGKIIPAISTTTSSICGYILSQIYILMRESYGIKDLRTIFFNFTTPIFSISQPIKVNIIKNKEGNNSTAEIKVPYDYTVWDKIEIEGNMSTVQLIEKLKKLVGFDFDFDGIYTIDDIALIQEDNDMKKYIEDIYFKKVPHELQNNILIEKMGINSNHEYGNIYLKLFGLKDEIIMVIFPTIKYHYKKIQFNNE